MLGPGTLNWDFSVYKTFSISERHRLQFRTEFFNLFNRTQFAPPNTTCCTSNNKNFGVVTSTAAGTNPRLIQFAMKFLF